MPKKDDVMMQVMSRVIEKLDSVDNRLDSVDKTLVKQEANLGEHMRRTELAEKNIDTLISKIEPLEKHKAFIEGALKGIGLVATAVSLGAGLIKIISFFMH